MGEQYIETYRGCRIYYLTPPDVVAAVYHSPCITGFFIKKSALKQRIRDMFVGPIDPDPDEKPADGLLAQIVAEVKNWFTQNIRGWVQTWGQIINNVVTNVTKYVTNITKTFKEYVTNVYNNVTKYVTNVYKTFNEYITNVTNVTRKYITNNITNVTKYVTNIIGASTEWVDGRILGVKAYVDQRIAAIDTVGFFKNPFVYISGVFAVRALVRETNMIKSFLEGFEEGLEE